MSPGPPRLARLAAQWLLPSGEREFILGDMEELFVARSAGQGRTRATRLYLRDALRSIVARRLFRRRRRKPPRGNGGGIVTGILADLRNAVRTFRRERGFAALAVFTLALGVGSTAAVFGMVNQLLLRPLPGVDPSAHAGYLRLHSAADPEAWRSDGLNQTDFDAIRQGATLLEGLAAHGTTHLTLARDGSRPQSVAANTIYGDFFEVLGVRAVEGRLITASETALHADPLVAVISQRLRASLFPSDETVIGQKLRLNGHAVTILGVAGGGFSGPERGDEYDLWIPHAAIVPLLGFPADLLVSPRSTMHDDLIVRVREGVTAEAAEAQLRGLLAQRAAISTENREYLDGLRPAVYSGLHLPPAWRSSTYGSLRVMGGVVLMVLLIACANVANLMLVRNAKRRGTLATQRALGASTGRIARQNLTESLLLGSAGVLAGLGAAWLIALPFRGERLLRMPVFEGFTLDARTLGFAAAATIVTTLLFGTLPASLAGRFDLAGALKSTGPRDTGSMTKLRAALSAGQIALSVALLIGGLLLIRTVRNLYGVQTGLDIDNVLELSVEWPREQDASGRDALARDLIGRVERLPGVDRVVLDLYGPHGPRMVSGISVPGADRSETLRATTMPVTPGWFEMFGVRMAGGRTFEARDWRPGSTHEVIVTASMARRLFGTEDVVGRRVVVSNPQAEEAEIVGVTSDIRMAYAADEPHDAYFVTFDAGPALPYYVLFVRTNRTDAVLAREIRTVVESLLPEVPVAEPRPLTDRVHAIHAERRIFGNLLGLLSSLAVLLAAVGLYGVVSFDVAGRRREFGIRLALGARATRIAALVARHAGAVILSGLSIGLGAAYGLSKILESRLFGIASTDALSYAIAALLFAVVAVVACWAPVVHAMRVDPVATLKEQ